MGKNATQQFKSISHGGGGGIRTEVAGTIIFDSSDRKDARELFVGCDFDKQVKLVVAQDNVVRRLVFPDKVGLEDQGFGFGVASDGFDVSDFGDHPVLGGIEIGLVSEI